MDLLMTDAAREARARRALARQSLALQKSRCRVPAASEWQTYMIVDPARNAVVAGMSAGFGLSLDDVEEWLLA